MISEFRPECTVNLWLEANGQPAKRAWVCAIEVAGKRIVTARKFLGIVSVEEAEASVLLFGLRRVRRLLQEKVEVRGNFPVEGMLGKAKAVGRRGEPDLQSERAEITSIWESIRLVRGARITPADGALLAEEAKKVFRRR